MRATLFTALVAASTREKSEPEMCLQVIRPTSAAVLLSKTQPFMQIANLKQKINVWYNLKNNLNKRHFFKLCSYRYAFISAHITLDIFQSLA